MRGKRDEKRDDSIWVSPSQLELHARCPRSWFYKYKEKREVPTHPAAAAGTYAHEQLELRMKGLPFLALPHVKALETYLPPPLTPGYIPEEKIEIANVFAAIVGPSDPIYNVTLIGYTDLRNVSETYYDSFGVPRPSKGVPEINDFKFKGKRYWLSGTQLAEDLQLNTYAFGLMLGGTYPNPEDPFAKAEFVRLSHLYAERAKENAPPDAFVERDKVTIVRTRKQVEDWTHRVLIPAVRSLVETATVDTVNDTRVNDKACGMYNARCPHETYCTKRLSGIELERDLLASLSMKGEGKMGLFDQLKMKKQQEGAASGTATSTATPAPAPATATASAPPVVEATTPTTVTAPPVADAPVLTVASSIQTPTETAPLPVNEPATTTAPAEAPKRRGRPPKAKVEEGQQLDPTAVSTSGDEDGLYVYVNCTPLQPSRSLDAYLGGTLERLAQENNVPDIRCASGQDSPLSFGKWKGALAARIKAVPPSAGRWHIHGVNGDETKEVLASTLLAIAVDGARG